MPTPIKQSSAKVVSVKIADVNSSIIDKFNAIFCKDGNKILFCNKSALERALILPLDFRYVNVM
ncbi:MAG: hypothetical protein J1F39_00540 [Clostridiales bacterium]|nr:hypothetical protein [Clostridiales bacterium]